MRLIPLYIILTFISCKSKNVLKKTNKEEASTFVPQYTPGPQAIVYKTKHDYSNFVPVMLSDDKTEILSYPDPKDLDIEKGNPLPTLLKNGYLLDNRGIGKNIAFLKYTYQEYSKLQNVPTLKELYNNILDKEPFLELCDCGNKTVFKDAEKQLNDLIKNNALRKSCKVVK